MSLTNAARAWYWLFFPSFLSSLAFLADRWTAANVGGTITYWNLVLALGMVMLIAVISGYIGVRKVLKIEPFDIFRG